jgi:hypothetical protein
MTDRNFVLKWAHLGRGRPRPPEHRKIIEEERRAFEAHVDEIYAEQEQKNADLAARTTNPTRLGVAPRYANGIAHRSGPEE